MEIGHNYFITCKKDGSIITNLNATRTETIESDATRISDLKRLYRLLLTYAVDDREKAMDNEPSIGSLVETLLGTAIEEAVAEAKSTLTNEEILANALTKLIDFFSEFSFEPNFRFINTLARSLKTSKSEAKNYIQQYFELINSPYASSVVEKMKSKEFGIILDDLKVIAPSHDVNNRFKIYYGSQGTGKTTMAMKESSGKCIVCHSAMLPSDLMEDFKFNEGKAEFTPSELYRAIVEGRPIVLDEINLLPFESLRFLQGIVDGKDEFIYKGNVVTIAEGFKIIGTMNLTVNGMTYGLPEPLIDRCEETKKFKLTAKSLINAII